MRVFTGFLAALAVAFAASFAPAWSQGVPITSLPAATPQPGSLVPAVVNGVTSKVTVQQLLTTPGVTLTNLPTNQFAPGVLVNGQCVYATSATAIGSASCASLLGGSYVSLSPGSQQSGFVNLSGASTLGSLTVNNLTVTNGATLPGLNTPLAIPAGATLIGFGDSITLGLVASSCSTGTSPHTPTGTCWLDLLGEHYGAQVVNQGIGFTCLQHTTGSVPYCNLSTSGISRYTTAILPYAGANNNWFFIEYGTNDAIYGPADSQTSTATFEANYNTIVSALISAGTPPGQIVLGLVPYIGTNTSFANNYQTKLDVLLENAAIARVALRNPGVLVAAGYEAIELCLQTVTCQSGDGVHPGDVGHAALYSALSNASKQNAGSALEAFNLTAAQFTPGLNVYGPLTVSAAGAANASVRLRNTNPTGLNAQIYGGDNTGFPNKAILGDLSTGTLYNRGYIDFLDGTYACLDGGSNVTCSIGPNGIVVVGADSTKAKIDLSDTESGGKLIRLYASTTGFDIYCPACGVSMNHFSATDGTITFPTANASAKYGPSQASIFGTGQIIQGTATTLTSALFTALSNNGGHGYYGLESSTGGSIIPGSTAYSLVFGTDSTQPLQLATNNTVRLSLDGSGNVILPGATASTCIGLNGAKAFTSQAGPCVTTADTGTVTNAMLAGSIANAKLANSTISGTALGANLPALTFGSHLSAGTLSSYNGTAGGSIISDATDVNTASTIVARNASYNFAAGTITAALAGNASTATTLATPRAINGVNFDGSAAITVKATTTNALTIGTHLTGTTFDGSSAVTLATDCTSGSFISTLVCRDVNGDFAMRNLTVASAVGASGTNLLLNAASGSNLVAVNFNSSATGGLGVYDGGATNLGTYKYNGITTTAASFALPAATGPKFGGTDTIAGVNGNANNLVNTNASAPNPLVTWYNTVTSLGTGVAYGATLYHDGTDYSTGFTADASGRGWSFITYPSSAYPTTQAGFTRRARIDVAGNFSHQGGDIPGNGTTTGTAGIYSGTGVPSFSAPNGSMYLRYDGGVGARWYANTSGASTSGTTWTALAAP